MILRKTKKGTEDVKLDSEYVYDSNVHISQAEFNQDVLNSIPTGNITEVPAYIDDGSGFTFKTFNIAGKTSQVTTTGKNKMPLTNQSFSISGMHFDVIDGSLFLDGINQSIVSEDNALFKTNFPVSLTAGTYTLSWKNRSGIRCYLRTIDDVQLLNLRSDISFWNSYIGRRYRLLCHFSR